MAKNRQREKREFAEALGLMAERMGVPPMAGRIWGWLLVCDPPHQTAAELARAVGASRGSISTMTRLLEQVGLVERAAFPGERNRFYRLTSGSFTELLKAKLLLVAEIRRMADRGLEVLRDESPEIRRRLREWRDFYAFFEREFPSIIEKWEKERTRQ